MYHMRINVTFNYIKSSLLRALECDENLFVAFQESLINKKIPLFGNQPYEKLSNCCGMLDHATDNFYCFMIC